MENIIEGRNPVLEALRSGRPLIKIFMAKAIGRHGAIAEIIHLSQTRKIPLEYVERQAIDRLSETTSNQGIIALTSAKEYLDLEELLKIPAQKGSALLVVLDGIEDPHNLGAILRTAEATGVQGVIVREKRAVGLTPAVEKASAGAIEYVPVARVTNITRTIETLKKNNIWVVGIEQSSQLNYTKVDFRPPTAIVTGGEGQGISDLVLKNCDFIVSIPMLGRISSLNASVATAVVLYEVLRQRGA
jgi:23S rRNA (guanosine2251-2'-O)-methyltransferase